MPRYFQLPRNATFRTGEVPLTGQYRLFIKHGKHAVEFYSDVNDQIEHLYDQPIQFHDLTPVWLI